MSGKEDVTKRLQALEHAKFVPSKIGTYLMNDFLTDKDVTRISLMIQYNQMLGDQQDRIIRMAQDGYEIETRID